MILPKNDGISFFMIKFNRAKTETHSEENQLSTALNSIKSERRCVVIRNQIINRMKHNKKVCMSNLVPQSTAISSARNTDKALILWAFIQVPPPHFSSCLVIFTINEEWTINCHSRPCGFRDGLYNCEFVAFGFIYKLFAFIWCKLRNAWFDQQSDCYVYHRKRIKSIQSASHIS